MSRRSAANARAASPTSASGADGTATSARTLAIAAADARKGESGGRDVRRPLRLRTRAARRLHHCARRRRVQKERGNETKNEGKGAASERGHKGKGCEGEEDNKNETRLAAAAAESSASERLATNGARHLGRRQPPGAFAATLSKAAILVLRHERVVHPASGRKLAFPTRAIHPTLISGSVDLTTQRIVTGYILNKEKVINYNLVQ